MYVKENFIAIQWKTILQLLNINILCLDGLNSVQKKTILQLLYQYHMFRRVELYVEENYAAVISISYVQTDWTVCRRKLYCSYYINILCLDGLNSMQKKTILQLLYQYHMFRRVEQCVEENYTAVIISISYVQTD